MTKNQRLKASSFITMKIISIFQPQSGILPSKIDSADIPYTSEIVEIEAVVSPETQIISEEDNYNVHIITLAAWKFTNENKIRKKELNVLRTIPTDKKGKKSSMVIRSINSNYAIENEIPQYVILKFKARINEQNNRAVILEGQILETDPHPKLLTIAQKLAAPVEIEISWLGKLTLNKDLGCFEGKTKWNQQQVNLYINVNSKRKANNIIKQLEDIWAVANTWEAEAKDYAVSQLLALKNESWLEEDETNITIAEFKELMTIESISIYPRQKIEFWFDDGDLFWGHAIRVNTDFDGNFSDAGIEG